MFLDLKLEQHCLFYPCVRGVHPWQFPILDGHTRSFLAQRRWLSPCAVKIFLWKIIVSSATVLNAQKTYQ